VLIALPKCKRSPLVGFIPVALLHTQVKNGPGGKSALRKVQNRATRGSIMPGSTPSSL
jgi:hypothetical protein